MAKGKAAPGSFSGSKSKWELVGERRKSEMPWTAVLPVLPVYLAGLSTARVSNLVCLELGLKCMVLAHSPEMLMFLKHTLGAIATGFLYVAGL